MSTQADDHFGLRCNRLAVSTSEELPMLRDEAHVLCTARRLISGNYCKSCLSAVVPVRRHLI